jgi:hypothetical protein
MHHYSTYRKHSTMRNGELGDHLNSINKEIRDANKKNHNMSDSYKHTDTPQKRKANSPEVEQPTRETANKMLERIGSKITYSITSPLTTDKNLTTPPHRTLRKNP